MSKKSQVEQNAIELLKSIRQKDKFLFDAYVDLLQFFSINASNLAGLDILGDIDGLEVGDSGVEEKELAQMEKRISLMTKFSEKYGYYVDTLEKLRVQLDDKTRERMDQEIEYANKSGLSLEERLSRKK
jgi:hypothetical protein